MRKFPAVIQEDGDHPGSYFFSAYLNIPSLSKTGPINILLDTGSEENIIGENDLKKLGINIADLPIAARQVGGWGGSAETHEIADNDCCLILTDDAKQSEAFSMPLSLCAKNPKETKEFRKKGLTKSKTMAIPSVIGRSFLLHNDLLVHIDTKRKDIYLFTR